ncbi:hypothetical protein Gompeii16_42 [Mycobacterium phage Gompeii16]|uniref:hypothetical protein n=1 Tax=Mycobacterium phage Gompeii16 TaxID=1873895 RepID=UPI0008110823|nr:hypothetical protein Gompeii16_42 [Mycobacterium phage Gompeii16]ANU79460.1 hypothetical protein Gompeii16_42 [Mycobacterium phage Gompeii16]ANU79549.1 hypothetical protein SEA_BIRCSAK_42 [Mycobacterium phage Bircsak]
MNKHAYESGFGVDHAIKTAEQFTVSLLGRIGEPDYQGRHRLPYGLSNIPYGTVIWSWSADAWIRRIKPEGKYPRNFTVVATAEEAAGLRRLK